MIRRIMHVSIAILCLALAYHLGSRAARAQASFLSWGDVGNWACGIDQAGNFYGMERDGGPVHVWTYSPPVSGDVVAIAANGGPDGVGYIVKANGDVLRAFERDPWERLGNLIIGKPTKAKQPTMGQLKTFYRQGGGK